MKRLLTYTLCALLVFGLTQTLVACGNMESGFNSNQSCCGKEASACDETDCDKTDCDETDCDLADCSNDSSCGGSAVKAKAELTTGNDSLSQGNGTND